MFFKPLSVTREISRGSEDYDNSHTITLKLATTRDHVLEISTDCVLCAPGIFRIQYEKEKQRALLNPILTIYRDKFFDDLLNREKLDDPAMKEAMGFVTFYRIEDEGSLCEFSIPLNSQTFDTLAQDIISGVIPTEIFIEFSSPLNYLKDNQKKLEFGWEPDGSRRIWNIPDGDKTDYLPIESIRFTTTQKGTQNQDGEDVISDDISPLKTPADSLDELAHETKRAIELLVQLSKTLKIIIWLMVALGVLVLI